MPTIPDLAKFAAEMKIAETLVREIPTNVLPHVVAHRGFHHSTRGKNWVTRPTENGIPAYEMGFQSGLHLAECDITITRDGQLLLCHDEDFMRVSKLQRKDVEGLKVNSQSCKFLQSNVVLQDGSTPATLAEALAVCKRHNRRMVVEMKPQSIGVSERVLDFFIRNPELLEQVESFISFNPDTISMLARSMRRALHGVSRMPKFLFLIKFGRNDDPHEKALAVSDMNKLHEVIREGELDGIIIRHDIIGGHPTLKTVAFSEEFKEFLDRYDVGMFGLPASGNDRLDYITQLISHGFSYVNTDLPETFLARR